MRIDSRSPLFSLLALVACSHGLASGSGPADFAVLAYSVEGETIQQPSPQNADIYHEVLKFYQPANNRMRLLDRTLLPATREEVQGSRIDAPLAQTMLVGLGKSYCLSDGQQACNGRSRGGVLRVSPLYRLSDDRVRVAVRYTSLEPNAPEITSTQVFLLERTEGNWVIRGRR